MEVQGASQSDAAPATASNPPYGTVSYSFPYNGSIPLGSAVTINSRTGLISGVAPATGGEYVIGVCVNEYRNGVFSLLNHFEKLSGFGGSTNHRGRSATL